MAMEESNESQGSVMLTIDQVLEKSNTSGLANLGATCYINTIVQCLGHCPSFFKYIVAGERVKQSPSPLSGELREIYKGLWVERQAIAPHGFLRSLQQVLGSQMHVFEQNDACEFLMIYLDKLNSDLSVELMVDKDDVKKIKQLAKQYENPLYGNLVVEMEVAWINSIRKEYSHITDLFYGQMISQIQCGHCSHIHHNYETYCNLSLSIGKEREEGNFEECLANFFGDEILNQSDKDWKCDKCNQSAPSKKTMRLWRNPQVLIVSLKRFDHNLHKNTTKVKAPLVLDVSSHCLHTDKLVYNLKAVAHHMGSLGSGHYNCICKHSNGHWCAVDDLLVREANEHEVEHVLGNGYIYFYECS